MTGLRYSPLHVTEFCGEMQGKFKVGCARLKKASVNISHGDDVSKLWGLSDRLINARGNLSAVAKLARHLYIPLLYRGLSLVVDFSFARKLM